jgi:fluoroacetyl-CoA thioesterase
MEIRPGLKGSITRPVTEEVSAHRLGVPGAHVLASPMLCLMFEHAAIEALRASVGPELRTLGVGLVLHHDAPTPVGFDVTVEAVLVDVSGNRLRFELGARDDLEAVATGTHDRVIVDWDRVLAAVARKCERAVAAS